MHLSCPVTLGRVFFYFGKEKSDPLIYSSPYSSDQAGAKTIHVAAQKGFVEVVRTLLQRGEHVDVKTNVSARLKTYIL